MLIQLTKIAGTALSRPRFLAAFCASFVTVSAQAADYTWIATGATAVNWIDSANYAAPAPAQGTGPTAVDNLIAVPPSGAPATLRLRGTRAINALTYSGGSQWTIESNLTSSLTAGLITNNGSALLAFRSTADAAPLSISSTNVVLSSGLINMGNTGSLNALRSFSVSGTTTVLAGTLSINVDDSITHTTGTYALGLVSMSGGTLHLNQAAYTKTAVANVSGLTGTAGTIDNGSSTGTGTSTLIITNTANFSSGAALANGSAGTLVVEKVGAGTQTLSGNSTYTGGTTISAGTLKLGAGGTTGSIVGHVSTGSNGTLAFDRSDAYTFSGSISGSGQVIQVGTGSTTLAAGNSYSGLTTVSAGTLLLNNASGAGTGTVHLVGGNLSVGTGVTTALTNNSVVFRSAASSYILERGEGQSYNIFSVSSDLDADNILNTSAEMLDGTAGSGGGVFTASFSATPEVPVANDVARISDVFSLVGTGSAASDLYVLQLTLEVGTLSTDNFIGLLSGGQWVNAGTNFLGNQSYNSGLFTLGNYGIDLDTNSAWVVVNQGSDFAVIPEPSSVLLMTLGFGLVVWRIARKRCSLASR